MKEDLLAGLVGLGCGVGHALYLLLVLRVVAVTKGALHNALLLPWKVHVAWPFLLTLLIVSPLVVPPGDHPQLYWFYGAWLPPVVCLLVGILRYQRAHPDAFKPDLRKREP